MLLFTVLWFLLIRFRSDLASPFLVLIIFVLVGGILNLIGVQYLIFLLHLSLWLFLFGCGWEDGSVQEGGETKGADPH